jgi:hypothetical protein
MPVSPLCDRYRWLYHRRGDDEQAAETLELTLSEAPAGETALRTMVYDHLTAVYAALGRSDEAADQAREGQRLRALAGGDASAQK